ncbi:MAG: nuclear transport factor 2 family protein [Pseudobacter sp.]|uniref:nuclear transport factor 2 family protein n=1 Tax=Pseudobacter sp. TaxID=2045420 RepID=UPI003F7E4A0C
MQNISATIEQFRAAILGRNATQLQHLLADELSYGHSDGHVEGKSDFISKLGDGTYSFLTMVLTAQTIIEAGNIAIVRHELEAKTNDEGKPGEAHLYVLLVWSKYQEGWKLIARQAVKKLK